jgi:hypothetical protein
VSRQPLTVVRPCFETGRGFLKLWRIKHSTVSPLSDVQGLQLNNQDVVDHLWLYDGTAVLMATRQGRFACLDLNKSKQVGHWLDSR